MHYNFTITRNQKLIEEVFDSAYRNNACIGIIGSSGLSKSHSIKSLNSTYETALNLKISPSSNLTSIRKELKNSVSYCSASSDDIGQMIEEITNVSFKKKKDPIYVIEDVENAKPSIILEIIALRKRTSKSSGLIFTMSESFYEKCFLKFYKKNDLKGISELDVDRWVTLNIPTKKELVEICRVNGIIESHMVNNLIDDCNNFSVLSQRIHKFWRSNKN